MASLLYFDDRRGHPLQFHHVDGSYLICSVRQQYPCPPVYLWPEKMAKPVKASPKSTPKTRASLPPKPRLPGECSPPMENRHSSEVPRHLCRRMRAHEIHYPSTGTTHQLTVSARGPQSKNPSNVNDALWESGLNRLGAEDSTVLPRSRRWRPLRQRASSGTNKATYESRSPGSARGRSSNSVGVDGCSSAALVYTYRLRLLIHALRIIRIILRHGRDGELGDIDDVPSKAGFHSLRYPVDLRAYSMYFSDGS